MNNELTKREHIATQIMAGLVSGWMDARSKFRANEIENYFAPIAVRLADNLIQQLKGTDPEKRGQR